MKPSDEEWDAALAAVKKLRDVGDPDHLAKAFAYLDYRCDVLDELAKHAKRYVQFGLDEYEHRMLIKTVDRLREFDAHQTGKDLDEMGL